MPYNAYGWASFILGLVAGTIYTIQMIFGGPLGLDSFDRALVSFSIVVLMMSAIATQYTHMRLKRLEGKGKNPLQVTALIIVVGVAAVVAVVLILSMSMMTMSTSYATYVSSEDRMGIWEGFRLMSHVTDQDLGDLHRWGLGLKEIMSALLLTIPFLIIAWGTLAFLTAESVTEADGALFSFFACLFFCAEVWMFKLAGVVLY